MTGGVNISLYSCVQGLIQDLNLGSNMNVSSCRSIINVKNYCWQIDRLHSVSKQIFFSLKDEIFIGTVQHFLNANFRIRIIPFLKFLFSTVFDNTNKLKKSNLDTKPFVPQNSNHCHFWAVLDHGVSLLALVLVVCLCVYMISNQSTSKKPHVPKLRKLDVSFYIKQAFWYYVIKAQDPSQISLSRIKHQMCSNNPFSQRKKVTKRGMGWRLGGELDKIWKSGLGYIGGLHREVIRKVRNPVPAMTYIDIFT